MKPHYKISKLVTALFMLCAVLSTKAQYPGFQRISPTGFIANQGLRDITTNKFITISNYGVAQSLSCWTSSFSLLWSKTYDVTQFQMIEAIQTNDKKLVLMGIASNNLSIVKFDTLGNVLFTKRYTNGSGNISMSTIVPAVGNDTGFLLGGGNCVGSNFLIKCDANGNVIWSKQFNNIAHPYTKNASAIVHSGNDYLVASDVMTSTVTATANDAAMMRVDANGNMQWYKQLSMPADRELPRKLIRRSNNTFAMLCSTGYNNGTELVYFFDSTLTTVSYKKYTSSLNINILSGAADNNGGLIIDGIHAVNASINKGLLFRVDGNGNILWQKQSDPATGTFNSQFGYMLKKNYSYIFGITTAFSSTGFGVGIIDVNGNGLCNSSTSAISGSSVNPFTVTTPSVIVSNIPITVSVPTFTNLTASFTPSVYCGITTSVNELESGVDVSVYPNPSKGIVNVKVASNLDGLNVKVINAIGQTVIERKIDTENTELDLSDLFNGIYFLNFTNSTGTYTKKVVIQK